MLSEAKFQTVAHWAQDLSEADRDLARRNMSEKLLPKGAYLLHENDHVDAWFGVIDGLLKICVVAENGEAITLTGISSSGWVGEGSVIKNEPRRYDVVALRDTRIALLNGRTFRWLMDNSPPFNKFLVRQLNERLGQFIAFLGYGRLLDPTERLARSVAWLFNPILSPNNQLQLGISQEEIGLISGMSRQTASKALRQLQAEGLLRLQHGRIEILDLDGLGHYGSTL
ncbi:transcriptional regulator [Tistrella bauzanensis]|uniref:Transcriptional regulator n=1 Tax=Tistrella bauzanensis TaxID=657419 RepID=A0ABQ1IQV3_9PROT|nr:Crp/Fnr family transcriptional regulator [Tistrella bauzanensis]GGB48944.1 transcriptional regulator [Tistrella bauzanensis]